MNDCKGLFTLDQLFEILELFFANVVQDSGFDSNQVTQQLNLMKFAEKLLCNLICCSEFSSSGNWGWFLVGYFSNSTESYRVRVMPFVFKELNRFKSMSGHISHFFNPMIHLIHYLEFEAANVCLHLQSVYLLLTNNHH